MSRRHANCIFIFARQEGWFHLIMIAATLFIAVIQEVVMRKLVGKIALAAILSMVPLSSAFAYSISYEYAEATEGSGKTTIEPGVTVLDFNSGTIDGLLASPVSPIESFSYTASRLFTGSSLNESAAPGSDDFTQYLSVHFGNTDGVLGSFTIDLDDSHNNYFGMYWGSIDPFNTLKFYNGATLVEEITGSMVTTDPHGSWTNVLDNRYVSFYGLNAFDKVVLESSGTAFEVDNIAFGTPVPEPGTMLLFGAGLLGLAGLRRRKER